MDIVDTFNHLIPSDQLDESLIVGQNLECEASNEFCPGIQLEDSLKNMLSDKDPMFGCSSAQFNLLDNEESAFQVAGVDGGTMSAAISSDITVAETLPVKRPVGRPRKRPRHVENDKSADKSDPQPANTASSIICRRPGRKPANRLGKSFLIEKGVKGAKLKELLFLGGRININTFDGGSWLNPTVILRRLTVTIGGFRIELLPGPSYSQTVDESQTTCFEEGLSYSGDIGFTMLQDASVNIQTPLPDNVAEIDVMEKSCMADAPLGLGPYVNPNEVQTANGTLVGSPPVRETKLDNHGASEKQDTSSKQKDGFKSQQKINNNKTSHIIESTEKQKNIHLKLPEPKQGLTSVKNKELASGQQRAITKRLKASQNTQSKRVNKDEKPDTKIVKDKEKKGIVSLKRPIENTQSCHDAKVQRTQGMMEVKPKLPTSPSSLVKKISFSGNREQLGPSKPTHPQHRGEGIQATQSRPGQSLKIPEESGQERLIVKRPEKILHKQKSRTISVDEPELFIPDNAPVVKKEAIEEQPANSENVWDGNNCCGLCKKRHNNTFMVGCGRCDDWFHGDCVGLDLTKIREMEEEDQMYVCLKCCEEESKKVEPEPPSALKSENQVKNEVQDQKTTPNKPRPGPSQSLTSGVVTSVRKESDRRQSTDLKTGFYSKHETKSKPSSSKKPVSVEQIRRSVRDSLKEILTQRLKESSLNVTVEKASEIAKKTERELFHLYKDTDSKYKNKYRSLMFNLRDTKNNVLFKKVLKGEISPGILIRMSPEELASKELAAWRQRENRHTIEMIEKEQREAERRPITKITHKGEIEIESLEPVKAPETAEPEPPPKATQVTLAEPTETLEKKEESYPLEKDTTLQHKSHLFDLHCKICTGRMAPPVEEAPTKVVKVATTVVRRQSTKAEEIKNTTPPAADDDLHLTVLEESLENAKSAYRARLDSSAGKDETAAFLSSLKVLWRGFIHMASVAKLVTKAFPLSGILDNLTEDLPDSIQVGGRIGPQIVWDYLEKIRATGTKEVCLIRFSPETEEDEISYTLLYAYFSSRRRFGVVSNNLKQVKDMYLIPLGATEKVPHQLVPFDGPGLENNRPNLLLGLIIRQRPKRDYVSVEITEPRPVPEIKPSTLLSKETRVSEEDEKFYLSTLTPTLKKKNEEDKPLDTTEEAEEDEPLTKTFEEPSPSNESNNQASERPLRFLPGVLVGWGGELPPLPDVLGKFSPAADDTQKILQAPKTDTSTAGNSKSPTAAPAAPRERFIIKKKDAKPVKAELDLASLTDVPAANSAAPTDTAVVTRNTSITLKDKPPDVSTEAFLSSLSTAQTETNSADKGDVVVLSEADEIISADDALSQSASQTTVDCSKPLSGILKKSSAYSCVSEGKNEALQNEKAVTALASTRSDPDSSFNSQAEDEADEPNTNKTSDREDGISQADAVPLNPPMVQVPHIETSVLQLDSNTTAPAPPEHTSDSPLPEQHPPQVSGSYDDPSAPAKASSTPDTQDENHSAAWTSPETSGQSMSPTKDYKRIEVRNTDHHGRHSHHREGSHHGKKSKHHEREREKKRDRSYDDKHRERSRHHGHLDERNTEKRRERNHSDDHSSRHKDRHRHRRDSDHENGRRSSRDSY